MKNFIKAVVYLSAVVVLIVTLCLPTFASNEFDIRSIDSVVLIAMDIYYEDEYLGSYTGTGFFVGVEETDPQYIITNYHVIEFYVKSGGGNGQSALIVAYGQEDFEEAYVVAYDEVKDLAILKIAKPTAKRTPIKLKTSTDNLVGASTFAIGFPAIADETIDSVTFYGKNDASVTSGCINRIITESGTGRELLQIDANIRGGNSGGPLVDTSGYVIGVNTLGSTIDNNLNYAVSIDELLPLLNNNNILYEVSSDAKEIPYILIIGVISAVVLISVIVIVFITNRKKPHPVVANQQPIEGQQMPIMRSMKPVVRSMSAQHNGLTIDISSQPIMIGRDVLVCRIIFKEGTNGVSSKHCQLSFDQVNNAFILTDLRSTYGTFLSNGQKLAPSVPYTLKTKESFYLGEPDNILYVDME